MIRFLFVPLAVAMSIFASTLMAPAHAQQIPAMANIEHVPLSVSLAKQAIDATLFIQKNYGGNSFIDGETADVIGAMKARGSYNKVLADLRKFGFNNPESWSKTVISTAIAVGFMKEGQGRNMMVQLRQMQNDPNLSDLVKAQMMATVQAMMPPKGNMEVAKKILADRSYTAKVNKLFDN